MSSRQGRPNKTCTLQCLIFADIDLLGCTEPDLDGVHKGTPQTELLGRRGSLTAVALQAHHTTNFEF